VRLQVGILVIFLVYVLKLIKEEVIKWHLHIHLYLFFVSDTFFLLDENNQVNKLFFFGFSTVLKFMLFGSIVSSSINLLFELRMPDGELNTS
jgi:hypothetical protein